MAGRRCPWPLSGVDFQLSQPARTGRRALGASDADGGWPSIPRTVGCRLIENVTQIAPDLSDTMLESVIRGRQFFLGPMPTGAFNDMAGQDMRDLIAYLRTLR